MPFQALVTLRRTKKELATFSALMCLAVVPLTGCQRYEPSAIQMVAPAYPITAQSNNVEGVVDVIIQVGMDGRVLSASEGAEGYGVNRDLVTEALENARQWVWGPFPKKFQFPWYHNIQYVFKLQGKPTHLPIRPPIVKTRLPDKIEIIAVPCYKTYFDPEPAR
jgi:hypothetical protein